MKNKCKKERGSVTLYVLITCMFFIIILLLANMGLIEKESSQKRELSKLSETYAVNETELESTYKQIINENNYFDYDIIQEMIDKAKQEAKQEALSETENLLSQKDEETKKLIEQVKEEAKTEMENLTKTAQEENKKNIEQAKKDAMLNSYPIGSIYMSTNSANPNTTIGGNWVAWGAGRVPVSVNASDSDFSTVEKTGGSKLMQSHTHTFSGTTVAAGSHSHTFKCITTSQEAEGYGLIGSAGFMNRVLVYDSLETMSTNTVSNHTHSFSGTTASYGTGNSQNLQPYITCYMWKRIS